MGGCGPLDLRSDGCRRNSWFLWSPETAEICFKLSPYPLAMAWHGDALSMFPLTHLYLLLPFLTVVEPPHISSTKQQRRRRDEYIICTHTYICRNRAQRKIERKAYTCIYLYMKKEPGPDSSRGYLDDTSPLIFTQVEIRRGNSDPILSTHYLLLFFCSVWSSGFLRKAHFNREFTFSSQPLLLLFLFLDGKLSIFTHIKATSEKHD